MQREEGKRLLEGRQWSPVKTKRQEAAEAGLAKGGSGSSTAAPSRPPPPNGLAQMVASAQVALPQAAQPPAAQPGSSKRVQTAAGKESDAYDQASASAGAQQREKVQASGSLVPWSKPAASAAVALATA